MNSPVPPVRQVLLQKIFLKDASMEVPQAPQVFTRQWQPQVDVQMATAVQALNAEQHQVVLTVTITAKLGEDVAFLAEVHQAGLFLLKGVAEAAERHRVLSIECPQVLFPFAREAAAELIQRAGFPQLLLQPVNFEQLYEEHVARKGGPEPKAH